MFSFEDIWDANVDLNLASSQSLILNIRNKVAPYGLWHSYRSAFNPKVPDMALNFINNHAKIGTGELSTYSAKPYYIGQMTEAVLVQGSKIGIARVRCLLYENGAVILSRLGQKDDDSIESNMMVELFIDRPTVKLYNYPNEQI